MDPDPSPFELTVAFARIQDMLLSQENAVAAVEQLAQAALSVVDTAIGAGVSLFDDTGRATTTGATDVLTRAADALQYDLGEGPCPSAWATGVPVRIEDTATEARWPGWCAAAHAHGIRSVLSTPLVFGERRLGAMKVYATTAGVFTAQDETTLGFLAGASAVLLGCAHTRDAPHRLSASLQAALTDRQMVGVATGVLMERHGMGAAGARSVLLAQAQAADLPLVQIARQVLDRPMNPDG